MDMQWRSVPIMVRDLYIKYANDARRLIEANPPRRMDWYLNTPEVGRIYITKQGATLEPLANMYGGVQRLMGGPNPMTASLVGGALSAGLGYGGGKLLEKLFPERYVRRGALPKNLAIAAGLTGGLGAGYYYARPNIAQEGWRGLFTPGAYGKETTAAVREETLNDLIKRAEKEFGVAFELDEIFEKVAFSAGGSSVPKINKNMFNQAIIDDPWTSTPHKMGMIGYNNAAAMASGGGSTRPAGSIWSVAKPLIVGTGIGHMAASVADAMGILQPAAQKGLQQAGIWGGLMAGIVPILYGARQ